MPTILSTRAGFHPSVPKTGKLGTLYEIINVKDSN